MAAVGVESMRPESAMEETCNVKIAAAKQGEGLKQYYLQHIHELQRQLRQKTNNLNRLEAQRNELNSRGPSLTLISDPFLCWIGYVLKSFDLFFFGSGCFKNVIFSSKKLPFNSDSSILFDPYGCVCCLLLASVLY